MFDFSGGGWNFSWLLFAALGHGTVQTIYSYLGYYNVCNLGGEMKNPERNIPRAIFISILGITGAVSRDADEHPERDSVAGSGESSFIVSTFVERAYGGQWATLATALILITALGSVFSAMLGYSRVPYAAALDGNFFSVFARVHPTKRFPNVSLLALGAAAIVFSLLFSLFSVIRAILAMRCIIQFVGQGVGLILLHRRWEAGDCHSACGCIRCRCRSPSSAGWEFSFPRAAGRCCGQLQRRRPVFLYICCARDGCANGLSRRSPDESDRRSPAWPL